MLPLVPFLVLAPASFVGTWAGSVTIHVPNGQVEHGRAILWVGRDRNQPIGGIGDSETHLSALRHVRLEGSNLTFDFDVKGGIPASIHLSERAGHLVGGSQSPVGLEFDLQPAPKVHTLYETIALLDEKLFDAYNRRDLHTIEGLFSKDLEFFHDKDGLTGYRLNMDGFRDRFKEQTRYRRELDQASLEIYPVKGYGAMEVGVHRFYAQPPGSPEQLVATAKFVHIWANRNGVWKISRVVSYDHH